jgi:hypothetical protein
MAIVDNKYMIALKNIIFSIGLSFKKRLFHIFFTYKAKATLATLFLILVIELILNTKSSLATNLELNELGERNQLGLFSGRLSKINFPASLVRLRVKFENVKFLSKNDSIEFWTEGYSKYRCSSTLIGKSNDYLLLKVRDIDKCIEKGQMTVASHLNVYCEEMGQKIEVAKEVLEILMKKRLAMESRLKKEQKDLDQYLNRVELINKRYQILSEKLETEKQQELSAIEKDRLNSLNLYNNLQREILDIEHKLQTYRVNDKNLELDRWALDSRLYLPR